MFTGIIETMGLVKEIYSNGTNKSFWIESPLSSSFSVDQSIAHDGVCLTVEEVTESRHRVTAVAETLLKSTLSNWLPAQNINLERSLLPAKRLDGHFVQGHVDTTGICTSIENKDGSHELTISFSKKFAALLIEKGSVALNGISLTVFELKKRSFKIAVIPYTFQHTNLMWLREGDVVNIEFDMIGKYIQRNKQYG